MKPKTAAQINGPQTGQFILHKREPGADAPVYPIRKRTKPGWRLLMWHEEEKMLELNGWFTAEDLRKLADWIDNPQHPCKPYPIIDVALSKL